jgi:Asp-tRNA(Asn)/Glu-tRNA(Gln) amidotransferase A subunit family amidase
MPLPAFASPTPPSTLDALRAFAAGTLTPTGYLAACEARAAECAPWLHAFAHRPRDLPAPARGPFGGLPFGVKDIIDTADMPTENGAAADRGRVPGRDAWVVEQLRSLGGVVFGKTVTTEYAWRHPGATVNPHNPAHTPGGSSSGSAAAVAAGIVPLALGTQTVGSVIRPAAYCGVVGLKPSFGAIPRAGVHPLSGSLDHVGLFARRMEDVAHALSLLAAASASDPHGTPLPAFSIDPGTGLRDALPGAGLSPRLALVRTDRWESVEAPQREALEHAIVRLRASGAQVHELVLPAGFEGMWDWAQILLAVDGGRGDPPRAHRPRARSGERHAPGPRLGRRIPAGRRLRRGARAAARAAPPPWRGAVGLRRDPDRAGDRHRAARPRSHRRRIAVRALDFSWSAGRHPAGGRCRERVAARHPARRPLPRGPAPAENRRLG